MGFFSILLTAVFILFAALICIFAFKAVKCWIDLDFYRRQGIKCYYNPILGSTNFILKKRMPGQRRVDTNFAEYVKDEYGRGVVAATRPGGATPIVILISSDYIKDFLMKEDYFERKLPVATFPVNAGVMFEHGPDAMQKRSLLQSVMKYDDLKKFTPLILKMIYEFFNEFIKAKGINNSEYITIDLNDIYPELVKKLTRVLLFGVYDLKDDSIEALIQTDSENTVNMALVVIKNPVFNIAPSLFYKFPFLLTSMVEYKKRS